MFVFYWFWAIILLPLPLLVNKLSHIFERRKPSEKTVEIFFPDIERLVKANSGKKDSFIKKRGYSSEMILISIIWGLLVLSVMRPQIVNKLTSVKTQGYDIILAVDISASMKALDFSTNNFIVERLDITKEVVSNFAKSRSGDRLGLVLFGEKAHLYVPLTEDTLSISAMLNNSVAGMAGNATSIGDAIGISVKNLRNRAEGSRIIILLTDGDDTASSISPLKAAELAKRYNIRIYTIAIGKNGRVPYPDGAGGIVALDMKMDTELLKKISAMTGGKYYLATDKNALMSVYKEIDKLEKSESKKKEYFIRDALYKYPLGLALILFLIFYYMPVFKGLRSVKL